MLNKQPWDIESVVSSKQVKEKEKKHTVGKLRCSNREQS